LVGRGWWRGPGPRAPRPAGRAGRADLRKPLRRAGFRL